MSNKSFPKDFLWGGSTAAHQVEGNTHNQWSEWERANAQRLAGAAAKRLSWLPNNKEILPKATDPDNYISGNGVEHYSRYKEDFALLKKLHMNAYRFSIEWSRLEPVEGQWDEKEVEHYCQYLAEIRKLDIEPVLTLWHWTMPVWFTDKGGFEKRRNVRYFIRFVQKIAELYGKDVRYVMTLNEPNVYAMLSYLTGEWPPQKKNIFLGLKVYWNLVLAHREAYRILKQANPSLIVGVISQLSNNQPKKPHAWLDRTIARLAEYAWNCWYLDRIRGTTDIIGVNYYFTQYYHGFGAPNPKQPLNDLGWYMEPGGILPLLERLWKRYHVPLIITENGLADARDLRRQWWLRETIGAMEKALATGVDLRGYLHWSLIDNFEWAFGWWPKFGLIEVDRTTMRRTIRPSARWFAEYIKQAKG